MSTISRIIKSSSDLRKYKAITLKNSLQCLLVSDLKADKSAAAMNVNVGHLQDPIDINQNTPSNDMTLLFIKKRPGLAHFLEHMLFMGTEKYPNQSEYSDYLSKNGGFSNAYTSSMETNYYFSCSNSSIEGALERFSQFFSKPLFSESCVEKEMKAVDSEHQKNIMQDIWRLNQIFRSSAHPSSEFCKFGTGNLETLNHPTIRDDLIKFYTRHYSANLMRLVVYSNQDLPIMENWIESYFSDIPNSSYNPPEFTTLPFTKENLGNIWKIVPIKDIHQVSLKWIIPNMRIHYKNSPSSYISHLLGHEGENSLLSQLIKKGWAVELSSGGQNEMNSWSTMNVEISLTNKGVQNYEDVLVMVFAYIDMLKQNGLHQWVFEEIKLLSDLNFNNKDNEKPDVYSLSLASRMQFYPIEDVLVQPYLNENYDQQLIQRTIDAFTLENVRISLISKEFENDCNLVEPIYGTKYTFSPIGERLIKILTNPQIKENLSLIKKNQFLPKNMEIFAKEFESLPIIPHLIRKDDHSEVWFKQDNEFKKPKAIFKAKILFNAMQGQTKSKVLFGIWSALLKEQMRELNYMAEMAYLGSSVSAGENCLEVYVGGYNDSLPNYAFQLFEIIASFKCTDRALFDIQYEKLTRGYQNIQKAQPYQVISSYSAPLLSTNSVNPDDLLPVLEGITFEQFQQFQDSFMAKFRFQWLVQGNMTEEIVRQFTSESEEIMRKIRGAKILTEEDVTPIRAIQLDPKKTLFWEKQLDPHESNSAIFVYFQHQKESIRNELLMDFLHQIVKTPCFERLRTDEQLGYVVHSSVAVTRAVLGFIFMIQSNVKPPQYLAQRINVFLSEFSTKVNELTKDEFLQFKESIISNLNQKNKSVFEEANKNWSEIANNTLLFERKNLKLREIENVTIADIQELYKELFFTLSKRIEVHFVSQVHSKENEVLKALRVEEEHIQQITSIMGFKNSHSLFPDFYSRL